MDALIYLIDLLPFNPAVFLIFGFIFLIVVRILLIKLVIGIFKLAIGVIGAFFGRI
ncbi:hypothetical protein LCGC14_0347740 [marine sediment metagenome]|uniref:Uncharacterized protein n=1 Tax=marine sediment metagenome TaxID=412755 RepID=A0A0F9TUR3_9ZZZZ